MYRIDNIEEFTAMLQQAWCREIIWKSVLFSFFNYQANYSSTG